MFVLDEIQHYPVNWTNGMRVSATDFAKTDMAWGDALRDVRATLFQGRQFGLLPPLRDSDDTTAYPKLVYESNRKLLTLKECRAITEGGYRIEITENTHRELNIPLKFPSVAIQEADDFSVFITVDMFSPQGAGKMSMDAPPRNEIVAPFYELSVIYDNDEIGLSDFNHLKIAEYKYANGTVIRNDEFIPPCMTINSFAKLKERFAKAGANLKSIHDNGIILTKQYRGDVRPDVQDAAGWIEKMTLHIANNIWSYNDLMERQSPLYTLVFFKDLAQYILSTVDILEDNPYMKDNARSQAKFFKHLADPNFQGDDLATDFDRIDKALRALHLWYKTLGESFRQGRVIRVEDMAR